MTWKNCFFHICIVLSFLFPRRVIRLLYSFRKMIYAAVLSSCSKKRIKSRHVLILHRTMSSKAILDWTLRRLSPAAEFIPRAVRLVSWPIYSTPFRTWIFRQNRWSMSGQWLKRREKRRPTEISSTVWAWNPMWTISIPISATVWSFFR